MRGAFVFIVAAAEVANLPGEIGEAGGGSEEGQQLHVFFEQRVVEAVEDHGDGDDLQDGEAVYQPVLVVVLFLQQILPLVMEMPTEPDQMA